jgi:membrane protease YdiL (CAAX protease family)
MNQTRTGNIWLFIILAYAITWAIGIPLSINTPPGAEPDPFDISQLGALGPAIAGMILIYRERGKGGLQEFFRRITKWRIGKTWYLAILLVPLIWLGIVPSVAVYALQHGSLPSFLGPSYGVPGWKDAWWFFLFIMVIGGGQEEPGWRGYLLPELQTKHNAVVSSLIVGAIWSTWHLPFLFIPGSSLYGIPFLPYLIQLTALSFIFTWIYNNTGSILACILYHTWSNFAAAYLMVDIADPLYGLLTLFGQLVVVLLIIVIFGPKQLSRKQNILQEEGA